MDPRMGRFISVDPYGGKSQFPISLHRYFYANASPTNFSDPTGRFGLGEVMAAVAVYGILQSVYSTISLSYYGNRRPDDDRRLTFFEAGNWWKHGEGKELNIDLSSIDLGGVSKEDFYKNGNLLTLKSVSLAGKNYSSLNDGLVYGHITLSLVGSGNRVFATYGYDKYDWNVGMGLDDWDTWGEALRNVETIGGHILHGLGKPFKINLLGEGKIGE